MQEEDSGYQRRESEIDAITIEALLNRYEHLNHAHYQHNQVIHTTFYLSIVFFAGLLSIIFTTDPEGSLIPILSFFTSIIFLLLGVWAWRYNHGREQIKMKKSMIQKELEECRVSTSGDFDLSDTFFIRHDHTADSYKKVIHTSYYVILSVASISVPLIAL